MRAGTIQPGTLARNAARSSRGTQRLPFAHDDVGDEPKLAAHVGLADDHGLAHDAGGEQRALDLGRIDAPAMDLEPRILAPDEVVQTVRVALRQIAGEELAHTWPLGIEDEPRGRELRRVPVTVHDIRAPHDQLAGFAVRDFVAFFIEQPNVDVRERPAHRHERTRHRRVVGDVDLKHRASLARRVAALRACSRAGSAP